MSVWVGIQNGACGASAAGFGLRLAYVSTAWAISWCEEATSNTVSPSAIWLVSCAGAQGPEDTTTITLYGAYEEEIHLGKGPVPPRPAYGHSKDGRDDLKQVLLSLGVSSDGLPLRLGVRDGSTSDSTETPVAIEECVALGLDGVRGLVADSKAYCKRTLGLCLEQRLGLITLVPRTCAVRHELEAWGQQQGPLPLLLEKPGRTRHEPPRRWHGHSVIRPMEVEYADGRHAVEELRFLVVHSSQLAQQAAVAYRAAQAKEAERVAEHIQRVEARWFACAADAEAAISDYESRGQGRRGRTPRLWRYHTLHYRVEAVNVPKKRTRRGRPPKASQVEVRYRLVVHPETLVPPEDAHGWTVLATTLRSEVCTDVEILQAYQEEHITVEPGFRWIKNPAAISPVWLEKPERIAALAMLTVVGLLVYGVIQTPLNVGYQQSLGRDITVPSHLIASVERHVYEHGFVILRTTSRRRIICMLGRNRVDRLYKAMRDMQRIEAGPEALTDGSELLV